jgi:acyl-CoA reductase-like NAD-dependent aldehyde dehydrogenase
VIADCLSKPFNTVEERAMDASTLKAATRKSGTVTSFGLWLNGKECPAQSGAAFERLDPFDGTVSAIFANGDKVDADAAIKFARDAFDNGPWPRSAVRTRYQVLMRFAQILSDRAQAVAERMAAESGKPIKVGLGEVQTSVRTIEYYAGAALAMEGEAISERVPNALGMVLREPIGVAALITPWNFPVLNPVIKIAPALAAGCTLVMKPSHLCSGPAMMVARYLAEAGLPEGVLNVVTSDLERGAVGRLQHQTRFA